MTRNLLLLPLLGVAPLAGCPLLSGGDGGTDSDDVVVDEDDEDDEDDSGGFIEVDCTPVVETGSLISSIRSIHLSPDAPTVDAYVGSQWIYRSVGPKLSFGDNSEYYPSRPEYELFTVVPTGTTGDELLSGDATILLQDTDRSWPEGCYTVALIDRAADLDALVIEDDFSPIPVGTIRLSAIHAAPSVGEVDIYDVTVPGAPVLVEEDLEFGTAGAPVGLPATAFSLGLDVDDDGRSDLVFDVPELSEGSVVNAFAVEDDLGDVAVIAQLDDGTSVRIDPR